MANAAADSSRKTVTTNFGKGKELKEWQGIGWFRLWIQVDTALTKKPLGLRRAVLAQSLIDQLCTVWAVPQLQSLLFPLLAHLGPSFL